MPFDTCWRSEVITAYMHLMNQSLIQSLRNSTKCPDPLGSEFGQHIKKREKTKMFTRNDCVDSQLWKYQVKLHHLWWYLGGSRGRMMPKRPESISDLPPTKNILWISKCSMYDRGAQELLTHLQFSVSQESTESPLRTVLHDDDPPHW